MMSVSARERVALVLGLMAAIALVLQLGGLLQREPAKEVVVAQRLLSDGDSVPAVQLSWVSRWPTASAAPGTQRTVLLGDLARDAACTLIFFFDPACPACNAVAPEWSDRSHLPKGTESDDVFFVAVSDDHDTLRQFMEHYKLEYALLRLTHSSERRDIGIPGYPTLWLVRHGTIQRAGSGAALATPDALRADACVAQEPLGAAGSSAP